MGDSQEGTPTKTIKNIAMFSSVERTDDFGDAKEAAGTAPSRGKARDTEGRRTNRR